MLFSLGVFVGRELTMRHFRVRYSDKKPVVEEEYKQPTIFAPSGWGEGPTIKVKSDPIKPRTGTKIVRGDDKTEFETELRQMKKSD
jgi:hypothetical protein